MVRGASMGPEDPLKTFKSVLKNLLTAPEVREHVQSQGSQLHHLRKIWVAWHKSLKMKQQKGEARMEAIGEEDEAERRQHDLGSAK